MYSPSLNSCQIIRTMLLVILFLSVGATARINPHGPTVVSDFANCVKGLVEANFGEPGLIYIVNTNNVSTPVAAIRNAILKTIHEKLKYSVKIAQPTKKDKEMCSNSGIKVPEMNFGLFMDNFEATPLADYFIAILEEFKDFTYIASRLTRTRSWNPQALFILVYFGITDSDVQNIKHAEDMLLCLFKVNVVNVVVIIPEVKNVRKANVFSWQPYDPPKYCGYYNESIKNRLYVENVCEQGIVKYKKNIFESKLPDDMKGCVFEVLALERQPFVSRYPEDPNIEKILINQLAQRFNISVRYEHQTSFRGEKAFDGDWDGALKDLMNKKGHILLGGIFPDDEVHQDFESSSTYLADSYTWVVPRALHQPIWLALFIIFQRTVWMVVIACFVFIALSWKILAKLSRDPTYRNNLGHYFINTWISNLGFCAYSRPVTDSLRVFFVFINIYCVLLLTGYQTKLIDVLTNPCFEYQISTVQELVESGVKCGGSEELHDLFENSTDPFDIYLLEEWVDVLDIKDAMIDVAVHRNFSLLCSRLELAYVSAIIPELSDKFGNYKYFAFPSNVFTVPMEIVALRGFPFMKPFSSTLSYFRQYGVNERVRAYFAGYLLRQRARLMNELESEYSRRDALSVLTLQGGYLALLFGYVSGTLVLIIEIIVNTK
uniref:Ionotropic receptor IR24 n=1 Tax=Lobesia botrana TaxID=209534 RepID=A0A345BF31_9NEOP|nr:ionotropic receptor IR24 [Lobesia botrana]